MNESDKMKLLEKIKYSDIKLEEKKNQKMFNSNLKKKWEECINQNNKKGHYKISKRFTKQIKLFDDYSTTGSEAKYKTIDGEEIKVHLITNKLKLLK